MEAFNSLLLTLDGLLGSSPWFPFALLGVGLFFTLYLGLPQFRFFRHAWKVLGGRTEKGGEPGDTTHFQALSTALSGTVGTGNIGGVGLAIFIGGPAALFWMWMTAFVGMATKLVEVTLSHKYRVVAGDGTVAGGPMFYMEKGLKMRWLAVAFAVATIISSFGTGNLPQVNNIALSVQGSFGIPPMLTGGVLAVALALVIVGGIRRIARVTQVFVPAMAFFYFAGALIVIGSNYQNVVPSFLSVFRDAFTGSSALGGFLGASFAYAFTRGVNRGLFSNEAGQGSAPIAHAAAKTNEPASEGMVSLLEPFIDTIVICTLTGLVILSSGAWTKKFPNEFQNADTVVVAGAYDERIPAHREALFAFLTRRGSETEAYTGIIDVEEGVAVNPGAFTIINARSIAEQVRFSQGGDFYSGELRVEEGRIADASVSLSGLSLIHSSALTSMAFTQSVLGGAGQYVVTIALALFAFSTAIAWSYYGDRAVVYLAGDKWVMPYRVVYCVAFFLAAFTDTTIVWNFAAVSVVLMALPNLAGIMLMRKEAKALVDDYWAECRSEEETRAAAAATRRVLADSD